MAVARGPRPPLHLFDKTMTVLRATASVDNAGSPKEAWSNHLTSVPCRVQPAGAEEAARYGAERSRRMWRVPTSPAQDIDENDRLQITDSATTGSAITRTMNIVEIKNNQLGRTVMVLVGEETD